VQRGVAYTVQTSERVAAQVAQFTAIVKRYWDACVEEIAADPFPRFGVYVDSLPIPGFPARTFIYEIREEISEQGQRYYSFLADFFPEHVLVYLVNERDMIVRIFYLRRNL
jgi:hypothetical protein